MIQNLGPGTVYFDAKPDVDINTGIKIPAGQAYEFVKSLDLTTGALYLVATATSDVRYMEVG